LPIRLIDIESGEEIRRLEGNRDYPVDLAFTSDGSRLVALQPTGYFVIWDIEQTDPIDVVPTLPFVKRMTLLPGDETAALLMDFAVFVTNLNSGDITGTLITRFDTYAEFRDRQSGVAGGLDMNYALEVSPDGATIAVATTEGNIWLWDVALEESTHLVRAPRESIDSVSIRQLRYTPDGKHLIYYNTDTEQTRIWEVANQREIARFNGGSAYFALAPSGDRIAWLSERGDDRIVHITPLDDPSATVDITLPTNDQIDITGPSFPVQLAFTPDGTRVVVGGYMSRPIGKNALFVVPADS
jgi:WD40 repeat protein